MFLILTLGALSIVLALAVTPLVRDFLGKYFLDHPDGVRKKHAAPVPRVGGIALVISYVITFGIALALPFTYTQHLHHELHNIVPLTLVASVVFFTGVLDDLIGLAAWQKLLKSNPQLSAERKAEVQKLMADVLTTMGDQRGSKGAARK